MATQSDPADGFALTETPGWQTLRTIIETSIGERPPKRHSPEDENQERLAKRVRGVRLE